MTQAVDLVDALNGTFGRHKGFRASHAKGLAVTGRFLPSDAARLVGVPMLDTEQPIAGRFSVGGGKPNMSDKSPSVRGIGLTIGEGKDAWTLSMISAPVFFANSAEQFRAFLAARVADPDTGGPNPEKVQAFNAANPNTVPHQAYLKSTPPCVCYSAERYHSCHAYGVSVDGEMVSGRVSLEPEDGRIGLSSEEMESFDHDFLFAGLRERLAQGPARWTLKVIVANPDDELADPTTPWNGEHVEIELGTVEISACDATEPGQIRVYDPTQFPIGIAAPQDDVFSLRGPAYSVSFGRRSQ
jgi:catalase